jgi:predicted dinucleotide-binding enzyme
MKIAVFGTGIVGQTIADKLSSLHHEVTIGTRDFKNSMERKAAEGKTSFKEWLSSRPAIKIANYAEAAASAELIINATNGAGTLSALNLADKKNLAGKVLLDISNPLDFSKGMPPTLFVCNDDSLGEQIQRSFPETKVVKSLNTMNTHLMMNPSMLSGDHVVFMSGNDPEAKNKVKELLSSFGWKEKNIIDLGDITTARGTEQLLPVWIRLWGKLQTPMFNFNIVR